MTSIEVQGAVVVATMRDIAGRVYEADVPVLDGRGGLPSPLSRLASYLYCLAILIQPDDSFSFTLLSTRSAWYLQVRHFQSLRSRDKSLQPAHRAGQHPQAPRQPSVLCLDLARRARRHALHSGQSHHLRHASLHLPPVLWR